MEINGSRDEMHSEITSQAPMDRDGFAMVTTLLMVLVLSVMAVGVVWIATAEKKTVFAESVHVRSVFSADAGSEAAINFIRLADTPPSDQSVSETGIVGSQTYNYSTLNTGASPRAGWEYGYVDYDYDILSRGTASTNGESGVKVVVSRLFKFGY